MQVLQNEDERRLGGQSVEEHQQQLEQVRAGDDRLLRRAAGRRIRQQPAEGGLRQRRQGVDAVLPDFAKQSAERRADRLERRAVTTEVDAPAGKDSGAPFSPPTGQLLDEPGLADAGLTTDDERRRRASVRVTVCRLGVG